MSIPDDQIVLIYRRAVDSTVDDSEGAAWWLEVRAELEAVIAAPTTAAAAHVIAWWHHDWSTIGDSPSRAAGRIRRHAASVLKTFNKERK